MKTYVLIVSRYYAKKHKKAGEPTYFVEKILKGLGKYLAEISSEFGELLIPKLHTMRGNYELWKKRADEINSGKAILSIRYWSDKPYRSPQVEICQLTKIGLSEFCFHEFGGCCINGFEYGPDKFREIANNDGLSLDDFNEWFKDRNSYNRFAIIHFTDFRY